MPDTILEYIKSSFSENLEYLNEKGDLSINEVFDRLERFEIYITRISGSDEELL